MKQNVLALMFLLVVPFGARADVVSIDFEDVGQGLAPESFNNGSGGAGGFTSRGAFFNNNYNATFASWAGWSYTNRTDATTPGFMNQYSAVAGGGSGSPTYAVASLGGPDLQGLPDDVYDYSYINLPALPGPLQAMSVDVTNTTYVALLMRDGDPNFFAKTFGGASGNDPDYLLLTITGYSGLDKTGGVTGSVDFYLADYRFADNALDYIVTNWSTLDLSALLGASDPRSIGFRMTSTDVGQFGMNTPALFALDNLTLAVVPEPSSFALLGLTAAGLVLGLRGRRRLR